MSPNESRLHPNEEATAIQVVVGSRSTLSVGEPVHEIAMATCAGSTRRRSYLEIPHISSKFSGLDMAMEPLGIGSIKCGELTVDELKKRLSHLIGVSLCELETLFDGH